MVAVEPVLIKVAETEPVVIRAQGIGANPISVERSALARALEMRQNKTGNQGSRTERGQMALGQAVLLAKLSQRLLLFFGVLLRRDDARDIEYHRANRRLVVLKRPAVLQIAEPLIARTGKRGVLLQSESCLHLPEHRAGVAEVAGELAPLGDCVGETSRSVLVRDGGEKRVLHGRANQTGHKVLLPKREYFQPLRGQKEDGTIPGLRWNLFLTKPNEGREYILMNYV
ncbi:MAG: hypothetical protein COU29_02340 [Candidatus Magasanikbacteria bacterium CG10_big_fil_rev_8_21_14_0_10_36_32]|uniref:Uncharacterized protein n=1 Tax=Candidatus Magasanikbacteria bacterium CG10_big_fil_rev_8_21_14_0_10_36_32 TaxID=1974646 RepID=A0A2M6W751_9BACT|nr:MAG: hypothetical protein COU29_02340 [Candidatus Magasanikbacteria bacterium CG10_big_fil_rev_8_21_14_0_10_36_32]